jgi:hypothetical protein
VTFSARAAAFGATFAISVPPAAQIGSPLRVSSSRRGAGSATNRPSVDGGAALAVNHPVMSTTTCPPLRLYTSMPAGVAPTIAPAARVWPARSTLSTDVGGRPVPPGATDR